MQSHYLEEIQELNAHLANFKRQSYDEIQSLKRQRDDAYKKVEIMEISLNKIKTSIRTSQSIQDSSTKSLKAKLEKAKHLLDMNESNNDDLKKTKRQISSLRYPIINIYI